MSQKNQPILTVEALHEFLLREFAQVARDFEVIEIAPMRLRMRLIPKDRHLRPGGTVSGPTLFSLADCAVYLAIIAHVGEEALAVTTNASIDFMRKPVASRDLIRTGRVGRAGDAYLFPTTSESLSGLGLTGQTSRRIAIATIVTKRLQRFGGQRSVFKKDHGFQGPRRNPFACSTHHTTHQLTLTSP